jgi:hypothetical protein
MLLKRRAGVLGGFPAATPLALEVAAVCGLDAGTIGYLLGRLATEDFKVFSKAGFRTVAVEGRAAVEYFDTD